MLAEERRRSSNFCWRPRGSIGRARQPQAAGNRVIDLSPKAARSKLRALHEIGRALHESPGEAKRLRFMEEGETAPASEPRPENLA